MSFEVSAITTYPLKGLAGQDKSSVKVEAYSLLPGDRRYALGSGTDQSQTAPLNEWLKKAHFLQMMNYEALAALSVEYQEDSTYLRLTEKEQPCYEGHLNDEDDSQNLCHFIHTYLTLGENIPRPRLFRLDEGGFTDTKRPFVAFGNQASIADFAARMGHEADARRYRLNVMMTAMPAFAECDLIGHSARLGTAELRFIEPVGRCAAIEVNPTTAFREKHLVSALANAYGAADMGVFAEIKKAGQFEIGDQLIML